MPVLAQPPLSPARPDAWTDAIQAEAKAHTAEAYPLEAVGIVEGDAYVRLDNKSDTPRDDIALSDDDLVRVAEADVFFHSHPDGFAVPSESDMIYQMQLGIPFVIMA